MPRSSGTVFKLGSDPKNPTMYGFGGLDPSERKSQVSAQLDREEESLKALEERMQTSAELTSGMKGQKWFSNQLFGFNQKIYNVSTRGPWTATPSLIKVMANK